MKGKPRRQELAQVMGFCSSQSRAVSGLPMPAAAASAELGKTSKVNSRAGNAPPASQQGQEVPHPALFTALPGRHLPVAKWDNCSP